MNLSKIIVHEIKKEAGSRNSDKELSDRLLANDEKASALVSALLNSYDGDRILYANFDNSDGLVFPERFHRYRTTNRNEESFINFSKSVITNLENSIKKVTLAKGGYFVFAEYNINNTDFVSIFLIRDTEGKILERTETSFSLQTIEYLNTNHLAMACQINERKLNQNEPKYLSFTSHKQKEVSDYFISWICAKQLESSSEFTKALYEIINQIEPPINPDTKQEYSIDEFRNLVYEFAKSSPQKTVNINILSEQLYDDSTKITSFAKVNEISINTEFRYDTRALRKFIQLHINRVGIDLKFSRGDFEKKVVRFSEVDENIVIIESAEFAQALRKEIDCEK